MRKVNRLEYMTYLKKKLLKHATKIAAEDNMSKAYPIDVRAIQKASTIGELFAVMSGMAFDITGAVQFAMEDLIKGGDSTIEFMDCPMRGWDT